MISPILYFYKPLTSLDVKPDENSSRSKRRKLVSKVWEDFTKYVGEDGK